MALVAQLTDKKWYSEYKNGSNFNQNLTDFTTNLRGVPHEKVKFVGEVVLYEVVNLNDYFISLENASDITQGFRIKSDSSDFSELSVGDSFTLVWQIGTELGGVITSVSDNLIYCDYVNGTYEPDGDGAGNGLNHGGEDYLLITNSVSYLKYKWGFSDSDGEKNVSSALDGRTNSFEISGLSGTPKTANKTIFNANDESLVVTKLSNTFIPENEFLVNKNFAQRFKVEHTFYVDDYSVSDLQDIENGSIPDRYLGDLTENYYAKFEFRNVESAPLTASIVEYEDISDIGWYNEKFNEGANIFSVSDVQITRLSNGEELEAISSQEPTKVSLRVDSSTSVFSNGLNYHIVHKTLQTSDVYEFSNENFSTLFDFENLSNSNLNTANGTIIQNVVASNASDFGCNIEFEIHLGKSYSSTKYISALIVGDIGTSAITRNTVTIPIDVGTYYNGFDIEGLIGVPTLEFFQRDCTDFSMIGASSFEMINAELINTKFNLPIIDGLIDSIDLQTIGIKGGEIAVIDTERLQTDFTIINGVQRINQVLSNPYDSELQDGYIKWISGTDYEIVYPYRMPFSNKERSVSQADDLYDDNENFDGWNQEVIRTQAQGYNIHIAYVIGMLKDDRVTYYRFRSPDLNILDFEQYLS